jgi:hypothetical protein
MVKQKPGSNKFNVDFGDIQAAPSSAIPDRPHERNEKRGPGRPIGKRSNPAYRQYTALIRIDTHDRAIEKLRRTTAKPDFGEYVEQLIMQDLAKS